MTWETEDTDVLGKKLREFAALLLIAKAAYTIDEDDTIALARRLRWMSDAVEQEPVAELKLAA